MKTIWVSIAIIAALLSACGENQQAPQAQNEPTKQAIKGADRYYVLEDNGAYGYERALSENEIKRGQGTAPIVMARYVGEKDGKWQVAIEDGSIISVFECSKPCEFIKAMVFDLDEKGRALNVERMRGQPGILAYSILQDAINGKLANRMGIKKDSKIYSVWFDENKGPILTQNGK